MIGYLALEVILTRVKNAGVILRPIETHLQVSGYRVEGLISVHDPLP